ncbi:MAG: hypothetical protein M1832_004341 [Thelocarpon impressellum]|nr:MAG: hypothetical protein M1832_004341 [Thelocarpon impressellum]
MDVNPPGTPLRALINYQVAPAALSVVRSLLTDALSDAMMERPWLAVPASRAIVLWQGMTDGVPLSMWLRVYAENRIMWSDVQRCLQYLVKLVHNTRHPVDLGVFNILFAPQS